MRVPVKGLSGRVPPNRVPSYRVKKFSQRKNFTLPLL
jgi:hypothetical protein